ncbi:MAG: hypothetical protein HUU20_22725 [Pirellulales bacterium]|nr:hypothetical protein [Pirellulales bacterium]
MAFFSIGFYAFFMLILGLMGIRRREYVVVFVSGDESAAHVLCNFLNRHGMSAAVQRDSFAFPGMGLQQNRVLVPAHEADEAIRLLERHHRNQEGPSRARD